MKQLTIEEIKEKFEKSLAEFYEKEIYLLQNNVNERSLTHKLAVYLQYNFSDFDIDCEYNLDIDSQSKTKKWISEKVRSKIETKLAEIKSSIHPENYDLAKEINKLAVNFYPDIIIHKRGTNCFNTLIIEAKKNIDDNFDTEKLIAFTKLNTDYEGENTYRYILGAKLIFNVGKNYDKINYHKPIYFIGGSQE